MDEDEKLSGKPAAGAPAPVEEDLSVLPVVIDLSGDDGGDDGGDHPVPAGSPNGPARPRSSVVVELTWLFVVVAAWISAFLDASHWWLAAGVTIAFAGLRVIKTAVDLGIRYIRVGRGIIFSKRRRP